jgi:hypothetical protein
VHSSPNQIDQTSSSVQIAIPFLESERKMVGGGRKRAEAASSSSVSDEAAAGESSPSDRDPKLDEEVKGKEESPSQVDEEDEGEEEGEEEEEEVEGEGDEGDSDEDKEGEEGEENGVEEKRDGDEVEGEAGAMQKLDEGFYEIEVIRKKRYRKGQLQYLIKWFVSYFTPSIPCR